MPITPGEVAFGENGIPASPAYGDIYHSADGGLQQAKNVFLLGCDLPQAWQQAERFVILETGFGLGLNFLATWQAYRERPGHCARLHFISVEKRPLTKDNLARCHAAWPELAPLAEMLREQWPLLVAGYHRLSFDDGRVQLTLIFDDAESALKQLDAKADAIYLDGFSPAKNPDIWSPALLALLRHLASPDAHLATWCVAGKVRQALQEAGFAVKRKPGFGHKKERLEARFTHASRLTPHPSPTKTAAIIGAGIAGSALAHALCRRGWQVTLIERHPAPAMGASGNPAGVVRPQLALDDSFNGRLSRQAFLHTVKLVSEIPRLALLATPFEKGVNKAPLDKGGLGGFAPASHAFNGVLQLARDEATAARLQAVLEAHRYPAGFARWVNQEEAGELAGAPLAAAGIHFPRGGWMAGPRVCPALLEQCDASLTRRFTHTATRLEQTAEGWRVWEGDVLLAETPNVILAGAHEAVRFANLPLTPVRGQITALPDGCLPGLKIPVTREGYVLPTVHGIGNIGASFGFDDDHAPRAADQEGNLARLARLLQFPPPIDVKKLGARVSFRAATPDRLPFAGAVAIPGADLRPEAPLAGIARQPGLFALTGLGARGLVWGPFLAEALAARLDNESWQLPRDLWQAIDPARFLLRKARRERKT